MQYKTVRNIGNGKNENESFTKEGEIEIPYTINITNAPESTTDEGGETTTKGGKA